jgi:hypothetical protein
MTLWLLNMSLCRPVKLQAFFGTVAVSYDCFQHSPLPTNDWWLVDASGLGSGRCLCHMIHGAPKHEETKNISIDYWTLTGNQDMFFFAIKERSTKDCWISDWLLWHYGELHRSSVPICINMLQWEPPIQLGGHRKSSGNVGKTMPETIPIPSSAFLYVV